MIAPEGSTTVVGRTVRVANTMAVDVVRSGDGWRIVLAGDIDATAQTEFRAALGKALARTASHLVIDLTDVTFIDSMGINGLVLAYKATDEAGVRLVVRPGPPSVMRTLNIAGIDGLLGLAPGDSPASPRVPPRRSA